MHGTEYPGLHPISRPPRSELEGFVFTSHHRQGSRTALRENTLDEGQHIDLSGQRPVEADQRTGKVTANRAEMLKNPLTLPPMHFRRQSTTSL